MADIALVTNVTDPAVLLSKRNFNFDAEGYKTLIKELIRLDVPILEVGTSSIGKSYSIREFMEECGIAGTFLFVGTEKSEFIEGIPNLRNIEKGQARFEYLKPYWFPVESEIKDRLKKGRLQLEQDTKITFADQKIGTFKTIKELWTACQRNYPLVETLKTALLSFKRTADELKASTALTAEERERGDKKSQLGKYIYEDALLYLSTLQGYGNFWLILDEIDKVEKQEKDKYAPLLHIVRERELKGWKLSGMREFPEYDIKNTPDFPKRIIRLNAALEDPNASVTDTRIIGIANDLDNIQKESPALYRRFVKIIIRKSLYSERKATAFSLAESDSTDKGKTVGFNWASWYESSRQSVHNCVIAKPIRAVVNGKVKTIGIGENMATIEDKLVGLPLTEMNLQWTLGFLPDILFPGSMPVNVKHKVRNAIVDNFNATNDPFESLFFKIVADNFHYEYWKSLLECVYTQVDDKGEEGFVDTGVESKIQGLFNDYGLTRDTFNNPDIKGVDNLLAYYQKELNAADKNYADHTLGQGKGTKGKGTAGSNLLKTADDSVAFGDLMVMASLIDDKPTMFTRMLMSSIPFMQTRMFASSPYVPFEAAQQLIATQNKGLINFVETVSGKSFTKEEEAKQAAAIAFALVEPYKPYIVKYGVGASGKDIQDIVDGNYKNIIPRITEVVEDVIKNNPAIIDNGLAGNISARQGELKEKYFNSIASVKLIEKEVYSNLPGEPFEMLKNSCKADGLTAELKAEITEYCKMFPYQMKMLSTLIPATKEYAGMADYIVEEFEKYKGSGSRIDFVNSVK